MSVDCLEQDVERLLVMKGTDPAVRKKAALCFLRFFRENPGNLVHSELADKMVTAVCSDRGLDGGFPHNCLLSRLLLSWGVAAGFTSSASAWGAAVTAASFVHGNGDNTAVVFVVHHGDRG